MAESLKEKQEPLANVTSGALEVLNTDFASQKVRRPELYSGLALAYLGDSVFDLKVKTRFVLQGNTQAENYHNEAIAIVSAKSQAKFMDEHLDILTEDEKDVYQRGRNAHPHSKAKNASLSEYKKATGFEAMIGYLYLSGREDRIDIIVSKFFEN